MTAGRRGRSLSGQRLGGFGGVGGGWVFFFYNEISDTSVHLFTAPGENRRHVHLSCHHQRAVAAAGSRPDTDSWDWREEVEGWGGGAVEEWRSQ